MTAVIVGDLTPGVAVRTAVPTDLPELSAMVFRCSTEALRDRTHGGVRPEPLVQGLRKHVVGRLATVLLAVCQGRVVGALELVRPSGAAREADLALLVEDEWQGRGIGRSLVERARELLRENGIGLVTFSVEAGNARARRLMTCVGGGRVDGRWQDGTFEATWHVMQEPRC